LHTHCRGIQRILFNEIEAESRKITKEDLFKIEEKDKNSIVQKFMLFIKKIYICYEKTIKNKLNSNLNSISIINKKFNS